MSALPELGIEGVGVWSSAWPDWAAARMALAQNVEIAANSTGRPGAPLLPPGERRRAPESVLLAVEAAQQACAMAQRAEREMSQVFASAYGDLAINDYLCATLARVPDEVSPTKFHNSVHNAAAGYWTIATGCMQPSSAVSAGAATFGAGLLEAATLAHAESGAVLFVTYDVAASGPLREVIDCREPFAVAFVLAPWSSRAIARVRLRTEGARVALASSAMLLHASGDGNPARNSVPLLAALARRANDTLPVAAGPELHLLLEISF
ncbi:MAG: beta-ketoacyl synthase chain length factor [Rudaea sp.]